MNAAAFPISENSQRVLVEMATRTGQSPTTTLDVAIEEYRRKVFFEAMNAGYSALRADTKAWSEEQAERKTWDVTNFDGLGPGIDSGESR